MPKPGASAMLVVSGDSSLIESCQAIADSIPCLRSMVIGRVSETAAHLASDEIKLVLVHLVEESDAREVVRLLHQLASAERALPLIVISEKDNAEQAWSLTRLGAADY